MPRLAEELSAIAVRRLTHPGGEHNRLVFVGGVAGLALQLLPGGGKTWLLRINVGGRRRNIGLGGYPEVSLSEARDRARLAKASVRSGVDPVEDRKAARAALAAEQKRGLLFREAVDQYLGTKLEEFKNSKHRDQWRSTLDRYALPALGDMRVGDIEVRDILRMLQPIWQDKTETASRLRGRVEAVLSWSTVAGHRAGDNPARWAGNLKELLPAPSRIMVVENQPAIQLDDAERWFSALRKRDGLGSRALEFLTMTATRSQEVRGAQWDEIDLKAGLWVISAARMKMKREHRVPLSQEALNLLTALPRFEGNPLVFPAARGGQLSDMTLSATMRRIHESDIEGGGLGFVDRVSKRPAVPHGLRSTFRDWVAERTSFPNEMGEVALAHAISNAAEAAYRRGDMVERRREMMAEWGRFLLGTATGKVVNLRNST